MIPLIQISKHIQNFAKHLGWSVLSEPCVTLEYSEPWHTQTLLNIYDGAFGKNR